MFKKIFDPIHGFMNIDNTSIKIIDNKYFKRLKNIKQLGTCYEIFPGASHNRFEHSIGVYHLTSKMIFNLENSLKNNFKNSLENKLFNEKEKQLIKIGALAHDLGHGPYSHVFDNEVISSSKSIYKEHEYRSCLIIEEIMKDYNSKPNFNKSSFNKEYNFNGYDIDFVKNIINPKKDNNNYKYQIVSNSLTGIDTDKFDYIQRDIYNIGLKYSYDFERIMNQYDMQIIDNNIVYSDKIQYKILDMFYTRYRLHKEVYNHPVVKAIEYMIRDILIDLDEFLNFSSNLDNINFINYTDNIIYKVNEIKDIKLNNARKLLNDIQSRNIYKYIGEIKYSDICNKEILTEYLIDNGLKLDDFIIQDMKLSLYNKSLNNINLFNKKNMNKSFKMDFEKITKILPDKTKERTIRLFCKNLDEKQKIEKLFELFESI